MESLKHPQRDIINIRVIYMKKASMIKPLAIIILLSLLFPPGSCFGEEKNGNDDESRVVVYVAFGGACAGLVWYIAYSTGLVKTAFNDNQALLNIGPKGLEPGIPFPQMTQQTSRIDRQYIELIKIRF